MIRILLSNDKTEVDMERLAEAFLKSRNELEDRMRVGIVTYWFEMGASNRDTPRMVFHSGETGIRVTLNSVGDILSRTTNYVRNLRLHPSWTKEQISVSDIRKFANITSRPAQQYQNMKLYGLPVMQHCIPRSPARMPDGS